MSESASTEHEPTADDPPQGLHEGDAALDDALRQRDDASRAAAELQTRVQALVVQLDHQRSVAANAARERDDYGMRLIDAEHRAAVIPDQSRVDELAAELAEVRQRLSDLEAELRFTHGTLSWRVTAPLRSLRTRVSGRNSG